MAKKKPSETEPMESVVEPKTKPVRLDLTETEHRELRAVAGLAGKSMSAFAKDVVLDAVQKELKDRGISI